MKNYIFLISLLVYAKAYAQLEVSDTLSDVNLIQTLAGPGLSISNVVVDCPNGAIGSFYGDNTNLGLSSGVLLTSGSILNAVGPNNDAGASTGNAALGDSDLDVISAAVTEDACVVEFDLYTIGDSLSFNYIFGSEEYLEYVGLVYNDVFGFFISGPGITGTQNIALIPGTTTPVSINNVNDVANASYYVNNGDGVTAPFNTGSQYIQYDGHTTILSAIADNLIPCNTYHLKLAVADAGDDIIDSGVFLEAGSFVTNAVAIAASSVVDQNYNFSVEGCVDGAFTFAISEPLPYDYVIYFNIGGTATNGVDYATISDSVVIAAGDTFTDLMINILADTDNENVESIVLSILSECNGQAYDSASLSIYDQFEYPFDAWIVPESFSSCVGSDAVLSSSTAGFFNHVWSPASGLNTTNGSTVEVSNIQNDIWYYVEADLGVCRVEDSVRLEVNPLFSSLLPTIDTSCTSGSVEIVAMHSPSSTNIVSYAWEPANLVSDPTAQNVYAFPETTTDFIVTMISDSGCIISDTIGIVVLEGGPEVVVSPSDTLVCHGESVDLYAEVWEKCTLYLEEFDSFGDGWNGSVIEIIQNGEVIASHTLENGSFGIDTLTVYQGIQAEINFIPGSFLNETSYSLNYSDGTSIFADGPNPGNGIVYTFVPDCGIPAPAYTYNWVAGDGLSSTNDSLVTATPSASSLYVVNAEGGDCTGTGRATIKVDVPVFNAIGDTICAGDLGMLNIEQVAETYNPCTYSFDLSSNFGWFDSSLDIEYGNELINLDSDGTYFLDVQNGDSLTIYFNSAPFGGSGEALNVSNSEGTSIFSSTLNSSQIVFQDLIFCPLNMDSTENCDFVLDMQDSFGDGWNGGFIEVVVAGSSIGTYAAAGLATTEYLTIPNGAAYDLYYTAGSWEDENTYTYTDPSGSLLYSDGPIPSTGLVFSGVSSCVTLPPDVSITWEPSIFTSNNAIPNPEVAPPTTTDFIVNYTYNYSACTFYDTANVLVIDPSIHSIMNDTAICIGDTIQIAFNALDGFADYVWSPNTNIIDNTVDSAFVYPNIATTYTVQASLSGGCIIEDSVFIEINTGDTVPIFPPSDNICVGDSITLSAEDTLNNVSWILPNGSQANQSDIVANEEGSYYYIYETALGCPGISTSFNLDVVDLPSTIINNGINPIAICNGDSILLEASQTAGNTYQWLGSTQSGANYYVSMPGTYTLNVTGSSPTFCESSFTVDVVQNTTSNIDISSIPNLLCCNLDDSFVVYLNNISGLAAGDSLFWNGNYISDSIVVSSEDTYSILVKNTSGCTWMSDVEVDRYCANPTIMASDSVELGESVDISVTYTNDSSATYSYSWSPSINLNPVNQQNTVFRGDTYGPIHIQNELISSFGVPNGRECIEIAEATLYIIDYGTFQMPNAFTPNNDGINDFFGPVVTGSYEIVSFVVYNRWGQIMFRASDTNTEWDGHYNGKLQPQDSYVYYISARHVNGTSETFSGSFNLIY